MWMKWTNFTVHKLNNHNQKNKQIYLIQKYRGILVRTHPAPLCDLYYLLLFHHFFEWDFFAILALPFLNFNRGDILIVKILLPGVLKR